MYNELNPRKIIYSGDCTIVFWYDGTKTIVRRSKGTKDDKHSAFCAALAKKVFNTNSELKRKIKVAENTKRITLKKKESGLSKAVSIAQQLRYWGCISCGADVILRCPEAFTPLSPKCGAYNKKGIRELDDFLRPEVAEKFW